MKLPQKLSILVLCMVPFVVNACSPPASAVEAKKTVAMLRQSATWTDKQQLPGNGANGYGDGVMTVEPVIQRIPVFANYNNGRAVLVARVLVDETKGSGYGIFGPGYTCVYVKGKAGVAVPKKITDLESVLEPEVGGGCGALAATTNGKPIDATGTESDPPVVARIDLTKTHQVMIGVPCVTKHWCGISAAGEEELNGPYDKDTKHFVKGWYDEQFLADTVGGSLQRSDLYAWIFPKHSLETDTTKAAFKQMKDVATIQFRGTTASEHALRTYQKKWKLPNAPRLGDVVTMQLKYDPATNEWWGRYRIRNKYGTPMLATYVEDKRHDELTKALNIDIPMLVNGTVRWGWDPKDESQWARCPQGCCEVGGDETKMKRIREFLRK